MADEPIELLGGEGTAVIRRSPFGVLLGIMPWNFPYYQVARFAGPNLVIGNTILLKHAPQCPESAEAMQQIFDDAGFPEGAYENIYATNEQIEWVIADPRVHGVSVTGSERAGAAVAEIAGRNLKKVVLELGGSDPFILLATEDLDGVGRRRRPKRGSTTPASPATRPSGSSSSTSSTTTSSRSSTRAADARRSRATRPPRTPRSARSPRRPRPTGSRTRSSGRSTTAPRSSSAASATATSSNRRSSPGSSPGDEASQEEFFGPVAQVYRVGSEDEAVELANQTPFGLGSYLMTTDEEQAERVADKIEAGMVYVNLVGADSPELPVRRLQALGLRPRARPLRRRRVRQQEADPQRLRRSDLRAAAYMLRRTSLEGEQPRRGPLGFCRRRPCRVGVASANAATNDRDRSAELPRAAGEDRRHRRRRRAARDAGARRDLGRRRRRRRSSAASATTCSAAARAPT